MKKNALLIGMSEYQPGLNPLPGAVHDMAAMQRVLQHPDMGGFNEVKTLANPDVQQMQEAIEALFSSSAKEDLTLLFFSGHGIKDDRGRLYFTTALTRKNSNGDLVKATAVPAGFVQDIMSHARCKRQVVILDCCFSGAFAEGMTAKDDGMVDVQSQLGGEGRAVLTSSTSTQYSFEQQNAELSVYTRFIVEGIETGIADTDDDGFIAVDELHDYARKKVQDASPAMNPKIYAVEEGFRIFLAKAPTSDPRVLYRKEVERFSSRGAISTVGRNTLDVRRSALGLSPEVAATIEAEAMKPYQEYQAKLRRYEQVLVAELQQRGSLPKTTLGELRLFQEALGLRKEDADAIAQRLMPSVPEVTPVPQDLPPVPQDLPRVISPNVPKSSSTIQPLISTPVISPSGSEEPPQNIPPATRSLRVARKGSRKTLWIMAAVVGVALVAGASARLFLPPDNKPNYPPNYPIVSASKPAPEPPAIVAENPAVEPEAITSAESPLPSPATPVESSPSPTPSPIPPEALPLWLVVVSSESTLEAAQAQVQNAQALGLSAIIVQRKEWFVVLVGGGFSTKTEAEDAKSKLVAEVPGWAKNKPFVVNQTTWCLQSQEQEGYAKCQN